MKTNVKETIKHLKMVLGINPESNIEMYTIINSTDIGFFEEECLITNESTDFLNESQIETIGHSLTDYLYDDIDEEIFGYKDEGGFTLDRNLKKSLKESIDILCNFRIEITVRAEDISLGKEKSLSEQIASRLIGTDVIEDFKDSVEKYIEEEEEERREKKSSD
jgi:hypothetical protein